MVRYDYDHGFKALKQIYKAQQKNGIGNISKYTARFLERHGFLDWYARPGYEMEEEQ